MFPRVRPSAKVPTLGSPLTPTAAGLKGSPRGAGFAGLPIIVFNLFASKSDRSRPSLNISCCTKGFLGLKRGIDTAEVKLEAKRQCYPLKG